MGLPVLNLSSLSNIAIFVFEEHTEKLTRCIQTFAKTKDKGNVQIVTNEQSRPLYNTFPNVHTTYDPNKYDYVRGSTFLFDDCFADEEWRKKDTKLHDFISYPRLYGLTTVVGFQHVPAITERMCWNLDMICIGANPSSREKIYHSFFLYLMPYEDFCDLLEEYTTENGFLVLRREGTDDKLYRATCECECECEGSFS